MGESFPNPAREKDPFLVSLADQQFQEHIFELLSPLLAPYGFALGGSGAIREWGLIDRLTEDLDFSTSISHEHDVPVAASKAEAYLTSHGYKVSSDPMFEQSEGMRRLTVSKQEKSTEIDLISDYRADNPVLNVHGWVLSLPDAVANKVTALADRGEARDYLDALTIHRSKLFTQDQLESIISQRFPHFSWNRFRIALKFMDEMPDDQFLIYVKPSVLHTDRQEAHIWINELTKKYGSQDYKLVENDDIPPADPQWIEHEIRKEENRKKHHSA